MGSSPMGRFLRAVKEREARSGKGDTSYPYYHVSDHPKTPRAHPSPKHNDPVGVFLFPKGHNVEVEWSTKKYRWDAKLKPGLKLLPLNDNTFGWDLFERLIKKVGFLTWRALWTKITEDKGRGELPDVYYSLWAHIDNGERSTGDTIRDAFQSYLTKEPWRQYIILRDTVRDPAKFQRFLVSLGYDGLDDTDGSVIYGGEPQIVIFDEKNIEWLLPREKNVSDKNVYRLS